jgi:hypothetical protein
LLFRSLSFTVPLGLAHAVSQKAKGICVCARSTRVQLVTRRAILREYPGHPYAYGLGPGLLLPALPPTWPKLKKLFHLELHDTEQIELRNHNGALVVLLYRTIYTRLHLRNLVGARQNVLYSIGTGGVADVIAATLSQMGRLCPL